jgi:hypothetical protein
MQWPLHVTLTRSNIGSISQDDVRALKKAFSKLRRTKLWTKNVKGGLVGVELTNKGHGWHPHLHTLCDAKWLAMKTPEPQRWHSRTRKAELCQQASQELMETWSGLIGQLVSSIKVRRCDGETAVREVLKYAVKGSDLVECEEKIGDAIRAISGGRLTTPYGSMFGLKEELKQRKKPFACPTCNEVGTMIPEEVEEKIRNSCRRNGHLSRH